MHPEATWRRSPPSRLQPPGTPPSFAVVRPFTLGAPADVRRAESRRVRPSPASTKLPAEEPPMMAATTAPLALRATTGRVVIVIVRSVRSRLRERWNDRQSEDDGSAEDGLAKNVASRRVCEL